MQKITKISELKTLLTALRKEGKLGFVPTMGALHPGHLSLVTKSLSECENTIVSIFVNPTQFNNADDLKNYPRDFDQDSRLLEQIGCRYIFAPEVEEMYPESDLRNFDFGDLDKTMEGEHRPGHFNGVGQIVSKLFDAVEPDRAYFGEKDFQQLAIIRELTRQLQYPIEIIACPTFREKDGLAMSSRNQLLNPEKRAAAPIIFQVLSEVKSRVKTSTIKEVKEYVESAFSNSEHLELEYFQIVDSLSLHEVSNWEGAKHLTACIAAFAGKVRLIDNIQLI